MTDAKGGGRRGARPEDRWPKTAWTLLAQACNEDRAGRLAREELVERYRKPVWELVRTIVRHTPLEHQGDELARNFLEKKVVSGQILQRADRDKGRFRDFLSEALRNYLKDRFREIGRHGLGYPDGDPRGWEGFVDENWEGGEQVLDRARAREVVRRALERARAACEAKGEGMHFELFQGRYLTDEEPAPSWRELGKRFGLDERKACHLAETGQRQMVAAIRAVLAEELPDEPAVNDEIAALVAVLGGRMPSPSALMDRLSVDKLREVLSLAQTAEETADTGTGEALPPPDPAALRQLLAEASRRRGKAADALLDQVCDAKTPLRVLREVKDFAKELASGVAKADHKRAAMVLYHAAVAAGFGRYNVNLSTRPLRGRTRLYRELAGAFEDAPLGQIFRNAVTRAGNDKPECGSD